MVAAQRFSYSKWQSYEHCPAKYDFRYVKKLQIKESQHNAVTGTAIQFVFESFYNDEIWRLGEDARNVLHQEILRHAWLRVYKKSYIDWRKTKNLKEAEENEHFESWLRLFRFQQRYENADEKFKIAMRKLALLFQESKAMIDPTLDVIKEQELLGPYAKSEVKLQGYLGSYNIVWGRADFILRRKSGEIVIFDGKTSKQRDMFLTKQQLLYYALCYLAQYKKLPSELGWLFYRYGEYKEVVFEREDLQVLAAQVLKNSKKIYRKKFERIPSEEACKYCVYKKSCVKAYGPLPTRKDRRLSTLEIFDNDSDECSF